MSPCQSNPRTLARTVTAETPETASDYWKILLFDRVCRLPFYVPLVWVAIRSVIGAERAGRAAEPYGHKESLSECFEGYRTELSEIPDDGQGQGELVRMTLEALAVNPEDVYTGKAPRVTPADEAARLVHATIDATHTSGSAP